eukprot:5277479-Pyramimonas_sp.AAC.1
MPLLAQGQHGLARQRRGARVRQAAEGPHPAPLAPVGQQEVPGVQRLVMEGVAAGGKFVLDVVDYWLQPA